MKNKNNNTKPADEQPEKKEKIKLPGYPSHNTDEDIYKQYKEEKEINPEDISKVKEPNDKQGSNNEKDFTEDVSGSDLDVPGAELDDEQEIRGSEDEENNLYSLGGDNHRD